MMSPSESPKGLFPDKRFQVVSLNKNSIWLFTGIFGLGLILLFVSIFSRSASAGFSEETKGGLRKPSIAAAKPPESVKPDDHGLHQASNRTLGLTGQIQTEEINPDILKEDAEYSREIRHYYHQQRMQKLAQASSAMASAMEFASSGSTSNGRQDGEVSQGQPITAYEGGTASTTDIPSTERDPNLQARKESFFEKTRRSSYLPFRKEAPLSPYEVKQGTVIPGIMVTGINSDLPGQIIGQVSQNVYDSATGAHLLIPQGTKIVGNYDSFVALGQERALLAWRRLIFPDGMSLELSNMPGADQGGYAGLKDQVNEHYMKIFGGAIMLSLIGAGYQISQPQSMQGAHPNSQEIVAAQLGQQISQVSGELIRRNINIKPTIEIRPGNRFNIIVNKDIILEPYGEAQP